MLRIVGKKSIRDVGIEFRRIPPNAGVDNNHSRHIPHRLFNEFSGRDAVIYLLQDVFLMIGGSNDGVVLTSQGDVVTETACFSLIYGQSNLEIDIEDAQPILDNSFISIDASFRRNIYHMLILGLSKYIYADSILKEDVKFLFPDPEISGSLSACRDVLSTLQTRPYKLLGNGLYSMKELYVLVVDHDNPAALSLHHAIMNSLINGIRSYPTTKNSVERNIYISRRTASDKRLNEIEHDYVVDAISNFNFEIVLLEDLTFSEQVHLFSTATTVVAPHGAGLTHIIFCQAGTLVIELNKRIATENHLRPWFRFLASNVPLNYISFEIDKIDCSASIGLKELLALLI